MENRRMETRKYWKKKILSVGGCMEGKGRKEAIYDLPHWTSEMDTTCLSNYLYAW